MRRRGRAAGAIVVAALVLSACASEAQPEWDPPSWEGSEDVQLISGLVHEVPETPAPEEPAPDPTGDAAPDDGPDPTTSPQPTEVEALVDREMQQLGVIEQRVRNDALPVNARWIYLPGTHTFNDRMDELVRDAIDAAPGDYAPQVFDTGVQDRGCVPGSLAWPAERLLTDPATGVADGEGTSITCEFAGAFGPYLGVSMRVVTSDGTGVTGDHRTTVYANLDTNELIESDELWNSEAAPQFWEYTIDLLRREAGALSAAPVTRPSDAQVALAAGALDAAQVQSGGSVLVTVPAGLAAPELAGLGIPATVEPVQVLVEASEAAGWANLGDDLFADAVDQPFIGLPAWTAHTHVDCDLVPCIAITYDDGPGEFTPALLHTLREHQAPATFFMLGRSVRANPEIAASVAAEGHEVGSHTMQHPDLTTLKPKKMVEEVMDAAELIETHTGEPVNSYRPPYGAIDDDVLDEVELPAVLWSIDTLDWERPGLELLLQRAVDDAEPGDIVLFHDIHEPSVAAAGPVFAGLRDRGFVPVTVSQMFAGELPEGKVTAR